MTSAHISKSGKRVEVYDRKLNLRLHCELPPEISRTSMVSGPMLSMNAKHSWYMTTRTQSVVSKPILTAIFFIFIRTDLGKDLPTAYTKSSIATISRSNQESLILAGFTLGWVRANILQGYSLTLRQSSEKNIFIFSPLSASRKEC